MTKAIQILPRHRRRPTPRRIVRRTRLVRSRSEILRVRVRSFFLVPTESFLLASPQLTPVQTNVMMIPLPPQSSTKMKVNIRAISSHLSAFWQTLKHISKERDVCIHGYIYISNASGPPSMSKMKADPGSHNSLRPYLRPSEFRAMP